MAQLVLGPLLRHLDATRATVWVETDRPCIVEVLGHRARTFHVAGHHYALVQIVGLAPDTTTPYRVTLDGHPAWPDAGSPFPPSTIRTTAPEAPARIVFGSCRVTLPHDEPYTLRKDADARGREIDALRTVALRMLEQPVEEWPTRLLLLGDQVYADEVSPPTRAFIAGRRDTREPPGEEIADFEEYTRLYLDAWSEPVLRWLLSTVPTAMIFDDHDVHDDWNISEAWVADMRGEGWWEERIVGAFMSYWIYQHLGNLSPDDLHEDETFARACAAQDAAPLLREHALRADRESEGARWSFCRDDGGVRLLVIDSRAGRVLRDGRRAMVDDHEWRWIGERLTGGHDHLIVASTLPVLLSQGLHYLEAWSEAVCDGAWGGRAASVGERLRRAVDLEHWAAFGESFERLLTRIGEVAAGQHGPAPASITIVSGDVHHAYLSEVGLPRALGVQSAVWQAVCSPFRNPLDRREQRAIRIGASRAGHAAGRALARAAGVPDPGVRWRMVEGPYFDNQVATLFYDGRAGAIKVERTEPGERKGDRPRLVDCFSHRLA